VKKAGRSLSLEVAVAGVIPSRVRAELVNELIKFILYQRNQIPMYFDQLSDLLQRESKLPENSVIICIRLSYTFCNYEEQGDKMDAEDKMSKYYYL